MITEKGLGGFGRSGVCLQRFSSKFNKSKTSTVILIEQETELTRIKPVQCGFKIYLLFHTTQLQGGEMTYRAISLSYVYVDVMFITTDNMQIYLE